MDQDSEEKTKMQKKGHTNADIKPKDDANAVEDDEYPLHSEYVWTFMEVEVNTRRMLRDAIGNTI